MRSAPGTSIEHAGTLFDAEVSDALCFVFGSASVLGPVAVGAANLGIGLPTVGPSSPRPACGSELMPAAVIAMTAATPTTHVYRWPGWRLRGGGGRRSASARSRSASLSPA